MALYKRRVWFNNILLRIGVLFSKFGFSPNIWTASSLIAAFIVLYFLMNENFLLASVFFIFVGFGDLVDGSVARVTGCVTKLGGYLDTIVDRYVELLVLFGLLFVRLPDIYLPMSFWLFLYLFGGMMTTYAKSAAKEKELVKEELNGGLFERAERLFVLFLGILLASINKIYLGYAIVLLAIMTNISAVQRIRTAIRSHETF